MKTKISISILLVAVFGVGLDFYYQPFIASESLGRDLLTGNGADAVQYIDFPSLREALKREEYISNLTHQSSMSLMDQMMEEREAKKQTDYFDAFVTQDEFGDSWPRLFEAMTGRKGFKEKDLKSMGSFMQIDKRYLGFNRFEIDVRVRPKMSAKSQYFMCREGFSWKLCGLRWPDARSRP